VCILTTVTGGSCLQCAINSFRRSRKVLLLTSSCTIGTPATGRVGRGGGSHRMRLGLQGTCKNIAKTCRSYAHDPRSLTPTLAHARVAHPRVAHARVARRYIAFCAGNTRNPWECKNWKKGSSPRNIAIYNCKTSNGVIVEGEAEVSAFYILDAAHAHSHGGRSVYKRHRALTPAELREYASKKSCCIM